MVTKEFSSVSADQSPFSRRIIMIWLLGTVALLPVNIINLPLNMAPVDYWIIFLMPILWLFFVRGRQPISLSYTIAMWIILVASLASTFAAPKPSSGIIVVMKEIYVFIWFVTLTAVLAKLSARDFRRLMSVWAVVVLLHGLLMIAQFLSPDLWRAISGLAGRSASFNFYRPSGLFLCDTAGCANRAAFFQVLGFVPLMLSGFSRQRITILGILLFASVLVTGSMGATLAFIVGAVSAVGAIAILGKEFGLIAKNLVRLIIALSLIGGIFFVVISQNQRYLDHFQSIIVGRADRSSGGRFELWERGVDVLVDRQIGLLGIGPANFRVVDWLGKQLHNDMLAFLVERGFLGAFGLVAIAIIAMTKALNLLLINLKYPERAQIVEVVFLAAVIATLVESLTHQIFHDRQLWLVLALQEAIVYKRMLSLSELDTGIQTSHDALLRPGGLVLRGDVLDA